MIDYAKPASDEAIMRSQSALEAHGITALVVDTPELALAKALALIPDGASVASGGSVTLETMGFRDKLAASGHYDRLRALAALMEEARLDRASRRPEVNGSERSRATPTSRRS